MKKVISLSLFLLIGMTNIQAQVDEKVKTEEEQILEQFKNTSFLQVENVKFPKELDSISQQIQQNISDVVLLSNTHTLVFAQKKEEYTKSYKKFYSLQIRIDPSVKDRDQFEVSFFYFNWTTNKMDKTLYRRISKFNVVNELRFGVYEILLGKDYVKKNKDVLDLQNYERIQDINKSIIEQKKAKKKKENLEREKEEELKELEEQKQKKKKKLKSGLKRNDKDLNKKLPNLEEDAFGNNEQEKFSIPEELEEIEDSGIKIKKSEDEDSKKIVNKKNSKKKNKAEKDKSDDQDKDIGKSELEAEQLDKPNDTSIPLQFSLSFFSGFNFEEAESVTLDKKVRSVVSFKSIILGANLQLTQLKDIPRGYDIYFSFGLPTLQKNIDQALYKKLVFSVFKKDYWAQGLKLSAGVEYSPVNFINVPSFGASLQLFENNFLWGFASIGYLYKNHYVEFSGKTAFMGSSSQNVKLSGEGFHLIYKNEINSHYLLTLQSSFVGLVGDLDATYKSAIINLSYLLEK